jgi:hypothetical protein
MKRPSPEERAAKKQQLATYYSGAEMVIATAAMEDEPV